MKRLTHSLPTLFFLAAIGIFSWYIYQNADRFQQLINISTRSILLHLLLILIFSAVNGLINFVLYRGLGAAISYNEGYGLAVINTLANQLPFAGGMVAKGAYLKKRHLMSYSQFFSATVALYVFFVIANGIIGLTAVFLWASLNNQPIPLLLLLGFGGMTAVIIIFKLPLAQINHKIPLLRNKQTIKRMISGWQLFLQDRRFGAKLIGLQAILTIIFALRFWLVFHMVSQNVSFLQCVMFSAATVLTRLVSISPGGLGVREAIVALVASVLGFDPGVSAVAVGIDRLLSAILIMLIGSYYSYTLSNRAIQSPPTNSE